MVNARPLVCSCWHLLPMPTCVTVNVCCVRNTVTTVFYVCHCCVQCEHCCLYLCMCGMVSLNCVWFLATTIFVLEGECQWLIKSFSDESEEVVDNMNQQEGWSACTNIFPSLKVSDIMDLVRVHGYGVADLSPLRTLRRAQGQALMEKIRAKLAGKRTSEQVGDIGTSPCVASHKACQNIH